MDSEEKFWARVDTSGDCWLWSKTRSYGTVTWDGRTQQAHRVAWMLTHDEEIPKGMVICHTCDNPPCVKPQHLFLGTIGDNTRDLAAKRRAGTWVRPDTIVIDVPEGATVTASMFRANFKHIKVPVSVVVNRGGDIIKIGDWEPTARGKR